MIWLIFVFVLLVLWLIYKFWVKILFVHLEIINTTLMQIYGELNRIRLINGDEKVARQIEKFDKKYNYYIPFFDDKRGFEKYQATKRKM